jgi:superfamily I DNA/RNA helicase
MKPGQWVPAAGITLEPNAETAGREQDHNVAVTAGPGAGKTELLAQRADFLLRTNTCPYPQRILAISFKADAAANLAARVRERVPPDLASRLDSQTFHAFSLRLIERFRPVLSGSSALDPGFAIGSDRILRTQITFQDFVPLATEILEQNPLVLAGLRATYSHVFLDEFQDCTANQYTLVRQAFHGTGTILTAVGDTKQRIMGWAGAVDGITETFANDFRAARLNLYQNFRSQPRLRRMQNRMVAVIDPAAAVPEATLAGDGGEIRTVSAADEWQEAAQITAWIQSLIWSDTPVSRIAVLFRNQPERYSPALSQALENAGIPSRNDQELQDLAVQPLTKLLVAYLETLAGIRNHASYARLHRSKLFDGQDEDQHFRIRGSWEAHLQHARALVQGNSSRLSDRALLNELAADFLSFFGAPAIAALAPEYESAGRPEQITSDVIDRIGEMLTSGSSPAEALELLAAESGVRIMSIHKSKGLEFDAVVIPAIEHEMFFGDQSEARAAFFVGISRARSHLLLTHASTRQRPPGARHWNVNRRPYQEFLGYAPEPGGSSAW